MKRADFLEDRSAHLLAVPLAKFQNVADRSENGPVKGAFAVGRKIPGLIVIEVSDVDGYIRQGPN